MSAPSAGPGDDRLLHHEYDGIQEYDNPLPGWWKGIFVASILFAVGYGYWFHVGPGVSELAEFDRDWKTYVAWKAEAELRVQVVVTEESLAAMSRDPDALTTGRRVYAINCVGCHLDDGRGQVGPNLTDDYQIHGVDRLYIYKTIHEGVPDKGMISWASILQPRDLAAVAAYVGSLRGTNVAGGKAPEGGKVERLAR